MRKSRKDRISRLAKAADEWRRKTNDPAIYSKPDELARALGEANAYITAALSLLGVKE